MPHVLKLKDGKLITPFDVGDVLETVEEYAGQEVRQYIEEYLEDNIQEAADFEAQLSDYELQMERQGEYQHALLCDIREELEALEILFQDKRLNRIKMHQSVNALWRMVNREL